MTELRAASGLTPLTMALYTAIHVDRDMADVAATYVARAWAVPVGIVLTDHGWSLVDLLERPEMRDRCVAVEGP